MSNGRTITIFCFSLAAMSVKSEIPATIEFSQFFEDNTCAQLPTAICSKFSYRFSLQTFIWSLWRISTHTNLQIRTIHLIILSMGMACFHPLARRCFPKTRSLRPRSRLLTGLLNMGSQSSHHQSLQLPREEQKSPTKGRDGVRQ